MGARGRRESDEHRRFEDMAVAHVVGGLSIDDGRRFRSHLLECPACRARVGELRAIAHDLVDVERDERRQRAAKRTETKQRDDQDQQSGDEHSGPAPGRRAVVVLALVLLVLIGLSGWNFILRGRLAASEAALDQFRRSTAVLQLGDQWDLARASSAGVTGAVHTDDDDMVVMLDGLVERTYSLYVLGPRDNTLYRQSVRPSDGRLYEYLHDDSVVSDATRVLVTRSENLPSDPQGDTIFDARRSDGPDS